LANAYVARLRDFIIASDGKEGDLVIVELYREEELTSMDIPGRPGMTNNRVSFAKVRKHRNPPCMDSSHAIDSIALDYWCNLVMMMRVVAQLAEALLEKVLASQKALLLLK
jgi:hypothetical protein